MKHLLPFRSVAVLGPGLLGGSVALAVRRYLPEMQIRLWARRQATLDEAAGMGITPYLFASIEEAVSEADLVVMATPIGCFEDLARKILPALKNNAIVTDVGSVKAYVHRKAGALLQEGGAVFIGSHPMAGSEKQGLSAAKEDLFVHASIVLTNDQGASCADVDRLAAFWQALGGKCHKMAALPHDRTVARISHVPHALAALCARNAAAGGDMNGMQKLASTGFRDTTRVCSGSPTMWADILWENDVAVRQTLGNCIADLQELIDLLENQNKEGVEQWLSQARLSREEILSPEKK